MVAYELTLMDFKEIYVKIKFAHISLKMPKYIINRYVF